MNAPLVLGIDGGGTKTSALLVDSTQTLIGQAQAGSTNWNSVGIETAHANLRTVIDEVLAEASCKPDDVAAVCIGASGVDRPLDRERMSTWLGERFPNTEILIHNDAVIALASGTGGAIYGVVLISGTGMICYGFDRIGNRRRAGGWGALLGDPGSGYAIGAAVLKAVTWAADRRGPQTALSEALLTQLGLERPQQLIDWTYRDISWERIASLAPLAIHYAQSDAVAQQILDEGATGLAVAVQAVVEGLNLSATAVPLVMAGGMLRPGPLYDAVCQQIRHVAPHASIIRPAVEPAMGAALLALRHLNDGGKA